MVVLTESSLNKRHHEFNRKVTEAAENNVNFDDVKAEGNESDIDNLFKIDLASKYKNIDYIIEVLKSGDSLCITRALKCTWIFESQYSHIINPEYISAELFPHLSLKSKKKLLTTISIHVRDKHRAYEFYKFCNSLKYFNIAFKFLLFTSTETKINLLRENSVLINEREWSYYRHFIGDSFTLAETCLEIVYKNMPKKALYELRYLYSHPDIGEKYLDLFETYVDSSKLVYWDYDFQKFGFRMSKDIILKHKNRIYQKPQLYTKLIRKSVFVKYSTVEDAKYYMIALLPDNAHEFWNKNYYNQQKHFFDMLPKEEKYPFIKKIFNEKYPGAAFEMTTSFYNLRYFDLIIDLELKEEWALRHIESEKEILGPGKDYFWYRFIKFNKSFEAIKKYIRINKDPDVRAQITNILIESARNDRDLETLFKYYYERHVNEERFRKERFIDAVDDYHNIFDFDSDCFAALDKIYYSLEVYNVLSTFYCKPEYKIIGLVYRIINNMEMPEALIKFMDDSIPFYKLRRYTEKLTTEKVPIVIEYLMKFYLSKIMSFDNKPYDESVKKDVKKYIHFVLDLMCQYNKPKKEIPEIVTKFVHLNWEEFKYHFYFRTPNDFKPLTENDLLCCLKRDSSEFVSKLPILKDVILGSHFKLNHVLRKLRVYFSNDLAKEYFKFYEDILEQPNVEKRTVDLIVFGIFHLADKKYLEDYMTKHAPLDPKIDHVNIDRKLLSIQSAICSLAGYARPPVSLPVILKYIKGDYTQYCLPLFSMYLANLQPTLCIDFVKAIVDAPLSIQKHGLRLAFNCFPIDELKKLVADIWKRTKNVSLRLVIYKALHAKILEIDDKEDVSSLFEVLNSFTSTVYEEDDDELFSLLTNGAMPTTLISDHIKTVWMTFENLPFKSTFIRYRNNAVKCLERNLSLIEPKDFIEKIVDEHVQYVFDHSQDEERYKMLKDGGVITSKWYLTTEYITLMENRDSVEKKINLTKLITRRCIDNWNEVIGGFNVFRNLFKEFLNSLKTKSYKHGLVRHVNVLFECILEDLVKGLPIEEIYQMTWELKLNIRTRNIIIDANDRKTSENRTEINKETRDKFGKECVALVAEYMEKNMFWIMFDDDIRNTILYEANNIVNNTDYKIQTNDIIVLVCNEFTAVKSFETFFLTSKMLPTSYNADNVYATEYKHVINKLQAFEDPQIKCFVYQRFIRNSNNWSTLI